MAYFVYVLESYTNKSRYVGFTSDLEKRLKEHNSGYNKSTCNKGPWTVLHAENFLTKELAQKREKFLKTGQGKAVLKHLIE